MRLQELGLQGIADLVGAAQARLNPGYNALLAPRERISGIVAALDELLFAEGYRPEARALVAPGASASRVAATLETTDGTTFRLMRDIVGGAVKLSSHDVTKNQLVPVSSVAAEVAQFLRGRIGLPSRRAFAGAFLLRATDLPSAWGATPATSVATTSSARAPDAGTLRLRLVELDKQLATTEGSQQLEWELDGLQKRRFEIDDELRKLRVDDSVVTQARAALDGFAYLEALGGEALLGRYEAYRELVTRRDADLKRWEEEREEMTRASRAAKPQPVHRDWRVVGGLALGTVAVVVGAAIGGLARYVALLDIPAFGVAVWALWQHIDERELVAQGRRRLTRSDERRAKVAIRDVEEIAAVEKLLEQSNLRDGDEIRDALAQRAQAQAALDSARGAKKQASENPRLAALAAEKRILDRKIAAVEERLTVGAVDAGEIAALRDEAKRLRAQLDPATPASVATPAVATSDPLRRGVQQWLVAVQDLSLTDVGELLTPLGEHASRLVAALTGGRLQAVRLVRDGTVEVVSQQGEARAWSSLAPGARDVVFLALRGGLVAAIEPARRMPFVLDVPSDLVWGGAPVLHTFVKTVAELTQVVHLVARAAEAPLAAQPFGPEQ
ncbi:MAG: hypothetical protein AAB426_02465 [Myxococcota bacterium]